VSASRPHLGLVTLVGTLTRGAGTASAVTVYRGRFTGMFGLRGTDGTASA
jgi:hypothetical protein